MYEPFLFGVFASRGNYVDYDLVGYLRQSSRQGGAGCKLKTVERCQKSCSMVRAG
jgi:hypothetical protein